METMIKVQKPKACIDEYGFTVYTLSSGGDTEDKQVELVIRDFAPEWPAEAAAFIDVLGDGFVSEEQVHILDFLGVEASNDAFYMTQGAVEWEKMKDKLTSLGADTRPITPATWDIECEWCGNDCHCEVGMNRYNLEAAY